MVNILEFWFPNDKFNKFWFDKSKDKYIKEKYSKILQVQEVSSYQLDRLNNEELLEKIIILDQFSRNIYRNQPEKIKINDIKSLELSLYYLNNRNWQDSKFNHLVFYLMPLRHTFNKIYYHKILEILNLFQKKDEDKELFDKFYHATLIRFNKMD